MDWEVTATVKMDGRVVSLIGPWGRTSVGIAARDIDMGRHRYFVLGPAFLETYLRPDGASDVWVPEEPNALISLPSRVEGDDPV